MAFTEVDEKLLVRAYQAGDERAFDTIVRTQWKALYSHAVKRLSDHDAAEDAVQDTLLRAYRALPNLDGDLALRAWLHRILTNVCYDEGNRRRRRVLLEEKVLAQPEEVVPDAAEEAVLHDTVRVMAEALKDLPETYREALVLRYVDGLSFREVAEATGTTEENARARVHRGRQALHKVLAKVMMVAAFVIPGLKRTHEAAEGAEAATAATAATPSVTLATQLTSHAMNVAPTMSRFAEFSASLPGGKASIAAAGVAAAAAVGVPVGYAVQQRTAEPERTRSEVAAPADTPSPSPEDPIVVSNGDGTSTTVAVAPTSSSVVEPSTTTTLPRSQTHPFEDPPPAAPAATPPAEPTTTTTAPPPPEPAAPAEGRLEGGVTVTGQEPQFDVVGEMVLTAGDHTHDASVSGRLYIYEDGTASSDTFTLQVGDRAFTLKFRARVLERVIEGDTTRYRLAGSYVLPDGSELGLDDRGDVGVVFTSAQGGESTLAFELRGKADS